MKLLIPERFETTRLVLQKLRYEDAEEVFYSYASKSEATKYVSWATHESIQDTHSYLRYCAQAWKAGQSYNFSIRLQSDNRLLGSIGAVNDLGSINVGYVVSPTHWNKGVATEACRRLTNFLELQSDVYKIWTFVDEENGASSRVLQKIGFMEEARLQDWKRFINQGNKPKNCIVFNYPLRKK